MVAALREIFIRPSARHVDRKSLPWRSLLERFVFTILANKQASGRMPPA
jgi:hypothetical protein